MRLMALVARMELQDTYYLFFLCFFIDKYATMEIFTQISIYSCSTTNSLFISSAWYLGVLCRIKCKVFKQYLPLEKKYMCAVNTSALAFVYLLAMLKGEDVAWIELLLIDWNTAQIAQTTKKFDGIHNQTLNSNKFIRLIRRTDQQTCGWIDRHSL